MKHCVGQIEQWANRTGLTMEYNTPESCLENILKLLSTKCDELVKVCLGNTCITAADNIVEIFLC